MKSPFFEVTQGREEANKIKSFIEGLDNKAVSPHNYKEAVQSAINQSDAMRIQIESLTEDYSYLKTEYDLDKESESFKRQYESQIVPRELFLKLLSMHKISKNIAAWKWVEAGMYEKILHKLSKALEEARVLENQKEVYEQLRELDTRRNETMKEMVLGMIKTFDDRTNILYKEINHSTKVLVDKFVSTIDNIHIHDTKVHNDYEANNQPRNLDETNQKEHKHPHPPKNENAEELEDFNFPKI